jgi:hypothetical protein
MQRHWRIRVKKENNVQTSLWEVPKPAKLFIAWARAPLGELRLFELAGVDMSQIGSDAATILARSDLEFMHGFDHSHRPRRFFVLIARLRTNSGSDSRVPAMSWSRLPCTINATMFVAGGHSQICQSKWACSSAVRAAPKAFGVGHQRFA